MTTSTQDMFKFETRTRCIPSQNFHVEQYFSQGLIFIQERSCHTKSAGDSHEGILDEGPGVVHEGEHYILYFTILDRNELSLFRPCDQSCDKKKRKNLETSQGQAHMIVVNIL